MRSFSKSFSVCKPTSITVCGCEISFSASARNRGFYITDDMSVELQIKNVCRSVYSAARLVIKAHKRDDVSTLLRTRHWLPIQARIEYKLSTLWHSIVSVRAPVYLSDLPRIYCPSRQLRFYSNSRTSRIPHMKTNTFGDRWFSYAAPSVWNPLPREIRHI